MSNILDKTSRLTYNADISFEEEFSMNNIAYVLGVLCGMACVALVCLIAKRVCRGRCLLNGVYDERQRAVQGRAYKYAFFTLMGMLMLGGLADVIFEIEMVNLFEFGMLCLWPALCVFATYCIVKDAYISLSARRATFIAFFSAIGLVNLAIGIISGVTGRGFMTDGRLDIEIINLCTGVACAYLSVLMCIKALSDRCRGSMEE